MLLQQKGAFIGHVDAHSLAWRAGLAAGDEITDIAFHDAAQSYAIASGEMTCELLRPACGTFTLHVRRHPLLVRQVRAAVKLQAAWKGTVVRKGTVVHESIGANGESSRKRSCIRLPPRLSMGEDE